MKYILLSLFVFATATLQFSCKDDYSICTQSKDVRFIANFYQRVAGNDVVNIAPNLSISLLNSASPIINNQVNASAFSFALIPNADSSKYVFSIANNLPKDTVTIFFTTALEVASPECGSLFAHRILNISTTLNTIDSIKVISPIITTSLLLNAKVYF